jgi:hypothetical protein
VSDSNDVSIAIVSEVPKCHLMYIDIPIVGDHPSRTESSTLIEKEFDIAILIGYEYIFPTIMIHISMKIVSDPGSTGTS